MSELLLYTEGQEVAGIRKLKLYIALTLDSYIAGPNGEIDWLEIAGNHDYGYSEFYASIDTTLSGHSTHKVTQTAIEDPYPGKTNYVFTRRALPQIPRICGLSQAISRPSFVSCGLGTDIGKGGPGIDTAVGCETIFGVP